MPPRSPNSSRPAADTESSTAPANRTESPAAVAPTVKPRAAGGVRKKKSATRKPPYVLLPVLVVDETLLL
ncbi:MAG: hypothetical protein M3Q50_10185, partial [Chloroflexota bacterium]|nr:hypothetical protein [Chloroflexota bacterium]